MISPANRVLSTDVAFDAVGRIAQEGDPDVRQRKLLEPLTALTARPLNEVGDPWEIIESALGSLAMIGDQACQEYHFTNESDCGDVFRLGMIVVDPQVKRLARSAVDSVINAQRLPVVSSNWSDVESQEEHLGELRRLRQRIFGTKV